ncbi:MAG: hypothetical protein V4690_01240 [Patescibacteria group bacterium]
MQSCTLYQSQKEQRMLVVLVFGLIGLVFGTFLGFEAAWMPPKDLFDYMPIMMMAIFVGMFGLGLGAVVAYIVGDFVSHGWSKPEVTNLIHLRGVSRGDGSFFLGTGVIQSNEYYFYYTEVGNGGIRPGKIPVRDNVTLFEGNENKPSIKKYTRKLETAWHDWIALAPHREKYEIYIPADTLKRNFDLQ